MTNRDRLVQLFESNGWKMTLGQLLEHKEGYKCTSRFSDLRKEGYEIECVRGESPSTNLYIMTPPTRFDEGGQGVML